MEQPVLDGGAISRTVSCPSSCLYGSSVKKINGEGQVKIRGHWLERLTDDDYRKAEEFVRVMKILYTSTLCISDERSPTLGQILPILGKLQRHFTVTDEDSSFTQAIKEKIWGDLSQRYQVCSAIIFRNMYTHI